MASLKSIKKRIVSVKNTRQITKAMKKVSAAKLRRAQENVIAARPYAKKLGEVLQSLAGNLEGDLHPLLEKRVNQRIRKNIKSTFTNCLENNIGGLHRRQDVPITFLKLSYQGGLFRGLWCFRLVLQFPGAVPFGITQSGTYECGA